MTDLEANPPRVFRGKRLVLEEAGTLWDLTAYLERRGQPTDLVDLFEVGWLEGPTLGASLPSVAPEGWQPLDEEEAASMRTTPGLPIDPRSVGKILALGKNFQAHAEEFGEEVPTDPLYFNKLPETLVPSGSQVSPPAGYDRRLDHEAELAVVIGLEGKDIQAEDAMEHVAGYTIANDLTLRSLQGDDRGEGRPWFRSKNFDGACPLGPCFVPRDFLDISSVRLSCHVNGELRQDANTSDWVVGLQQAIAHLSGHMTLNPGDIILTGTPAGVGPLVDGDLVVCSAAGIGELETRILRNQ